MLVYILLFNANTDDEGIHTVQRGERNTILMFQEEEDAIRFAMMLEAQDFPEPAVEAIDSEEIKLFCQKANYDWEFVEPGQLALPPETNLEQTDWETQKERSTIEADAEDSSMSANELDKIRNRLEGLL
jgi:hypothetical protein